MTERMSALIGLLHHGCSGADALAEDFHQRYRENPLVVDKWLGALASNPRPGALQRVQALTVHDAFSWRNPNKVRALIGSFARLNRAHFHAADGSGYQLLADAVCKLDGINPQIAARMVSVFNGWRRLEPMRQQLMQAELKRLQSHPSLSPDTAEIVGRALA